jgi:hypothetical protein
MGSEFESFQKLTFVLVYVHDVLCADNSDANARLDFLELFVCWMLRFHLDSVQ